MIRSVGIDEITGEEMYLLSDLFPSREYNPWRPPGYYVATGSIVNGDCAFCGCPENEHGPQQKHVPHAYGPCPKAPKL